MWRSRSKTDAEFGCRAPAFLTLQTRNRYFERIVSALMG